MNDKVFHLRLLITVLLFSIFSTLCLQHGIAQNYTHKSLPEGAKARLGKGIIKDILYSPDGKLFVVVSSIGLWLYDTKDYQEINLLPIPKNISRPLAHRIQNTRFSIDGLMLISDTEEKQVIIWDVSTEESKVIRSVNGATFSADGKTIAIEAENRTIELWHGKKEIIEKPEKQYDKIDIIIAFSPDEQTYATAEDTYNIRIKDKRSGNKTIKTIKFNKFNYQSIHLSPDGQTLATLNGNSPIRLWDSRTGKLKRTLVGHLVKQRPNRIQTRFNSSPQCDSVVFSPDGKILANGSLDGTIRLWNIKQGKLLNTLFDHYGIVTSLNFSPDGKMLASGSYDGSILVWDLQSGTPEPFIAERMNSISCVSFSHSGNMLLGGSVNGDIFLFDVETRNTIKTFRGHIAEISHLMFSPDDSKIASIGWDGSTRLWDTKKGNLIKTLSVPISVHSSDYWREMLFWVNVNLIAINSEYDFIHLWNVNSGEYLIMLMGHASHLLSFSVSADKKTLASFSADGTILLWDLKSIINAIH